MPRKYRRWELKEASMQIAALELSALAKTDLGRFLVIWRRFEEATDSWTLHHYREMIIDSENRWAESAMRGP